MSVMRCAVVNYYKEFKRRFGRSAPDAMIELALGVVTVREGREYCLFFDTGLWELKNPKKWGNVLDGGYGFGLIEGLRSRPKINAIETMAELAKEEFSPRALLMAFHHEPKLFIGDERND